MAVEGSGWVEGRMRPAVLVAVLVAMAAAMVATVAAVMAVKWR